MQIQRSLTLACALVTMSCALMAEDLQPIGVRDGFPSPDSVYPPAVRLLGAEGTVTLRVCVDAEGNLTQPPSIVREPPGGAGFLGAPAMELANRGSGYYLPPVPAGIAVPGCGSLDVKFEMGTDPRWPKLSVGLIELTASFYRRFIVLSPSLKPIPEKIHMCRAAELPIAQVRQVAEQVSRDLGQFDSLAADYLAGIDRLSQDSRVPEPERRAFGAVWPAQKQDLASRRSAVLVAGQAHVKALSEFAARMQAVQDEAAANGGSVSKQPGAPCQNAQSLGSQVSESFGSYAFALRKFQDADHLVDLPESRSAGSERAQGIAPPEPVDEQPSEVCRDPADSLVKPHFGVTTVVKVSSDEKGVVTDAAIAGSSGFVLLDELALRCERSRHYTPATRSGKPVSYVGYSYHHWPANLPRTCEPPGEPATDRLPVICVCTNRFGQPVGFPVIVHSSGSLFRDERAMEGLLNGGPREKPNPPEVQGCATMRVKVEVR